MKLKRITTLAIAADKVHGIRPCKVKFSDRLRLNSQLNNLLKSKEITANPEVKAHIKKVKTNLSYR